jgi:hypothetical protein
MHMLLRSAKVTIGQPQRLQLNRCQADSADTAGHHAVCSDSHVRVMTPRCIDRTHQLVEHAH